MENILKIEMTEEPPNKKAKLEVDTQTIENFKGVKNYCNVENSESMVRPSIEIFEMVGSGVIMEKPINDTSKTVGDNENIKEPNRKISEIVKSSDKMDISSHDEHEIVNNSENRKVTNRDTSDYVENSQIIENSTNEMSKTVVNSGNTEKPSNKTSATEENFKTVEDLIEKIVNSKKPLKAILKEEYHESIEVTKVYVGVVKNISDISKMILLLNDRFPLKHLCHLKRARKKELLLFPVTSLVSETDESIRDYMEHNLSEIKDSFESFKVVEVPKHPLKTKEQFKRYHKLWSFAFHPDKYLELLVTGEIFKDNALKQHRVYMGMAFEIARFYLSKQKQTVEISDILSTNINACVVVDPFKQSVVAVSFDNRNNHPIQHSAMIAIDNVAKTQNGGAWLETTDTLSGNLKGIGSKELLLHLKYKYSLVKFGAREYVNKKNMTEEQMVKNLNDPINYINTSPYLCTGYFIYLIREPCLMCAMGLVHARSKRVFFAQKSDVGALGSQARLQSVSSLNHHFEVFTDFF